ncbi:MAG: DUF1508 domain-containing protein [Candidatus Peribacter sp.]|jgi:uncharacterized protein YegP (UPF0339 family)|nr:DUF1508 domain-containing protein [Candidatus Peribacter sp.]MBT4393051.1 DUF1508 domain-containing protein [Candidatus Peribacter sp.]MBT4600402.1 DUF1508 domain-containing protein [Candidatus Peribacter sp.]MBT5149360.1 DUF1508 domain-containing protein [Candidatus Peribacter sp.]MBT5637577.1 DUF1508 domain-containing protein [Candidatus Peribacter sp.]
MTHTEDRTKVYKDKRGEWRWTTYAANNRIIGAATEGYKNHLDCIDNAKRNGALKIIEEELKGGGDN